MMGYTRKWGMGKRKSLQEEETSKETEKMP
jgi:hypothetical protein